MLKRDSNRQPPLRCWCSALSSKMCYELSWELVTVWCFTLQKYCSVLYRRSLPRLWCSLFQTISCLTINSNMLINDWTVFWFHDFGINRCRVVVMTHQNILLESTGQWLVLNVINLSQFGRKVRFPLRKETYSTLSILFFQFYANLELSERIKGFATKKIADLLSLLYQSPYYIIILLTECIYPPTRNSREGPLIR